MTWKWLSERTFSLSAERLYRVCLWWLNDVLPVSLKPPEPVDPVLFVMWTVSGVFKRQRLDGWTKHPGKHLNSQKMLNKVKCSKALAFWSYCQTCSKWKCDHTFISLCCFLKCKIVLSLVEVFWLCNFVLQNRKVLFKMKICLQLCNIVWHLLATVMDHVLQSKTLKTVDCLY